MDSTNLIDKLRAWPWLVAALFTTLIVGLLAPHQLGLLAWALSKLSLGAYLGYWVDRSLFPYARPDRMLDNSPDLAMLRRALIVSACVIALGMGV
jgi:hypothetical protein